MVMKRNAMGKNLRQSIRNSLGRYLAIVAIIALGAAMFVGLLMTRSDMVATGQVYMDEQNMFDLRLLSSYGWNRDQVAEIAQMEGVVDAEGQIYLDVIVQVGQETDESVYRFYSMPEQVNKLVLRGGRMPQRDDECLVDGFHRSDEILGTTITVSENNAEDTLDAMTCKTYTVVGYVSTPLYMDMNRGNTTVGSGTLSSYVFIPETAFDVDYYTEIDITVRGDYNVYTDAYNDAMTEMARELEGELEPLAQRRFRQVKTDALAAYRDGLKEYNDGYREFREAKQEAKIQMEDAEQQLRDAESQIETNEKLLSDGEIQIEDGKAALKSSERTLIESRRALLNAKSDAYAQLAEANTQLLAQYKTVNENLRQTNDGLLQISNGMIQLTAGITQLEAGLSQLDSGIQQMDTLIGIMDTAIEIARKALDTAAQMPDADPDTIAQLEQKLQELVDKREEYVAKRAEYAAMRDEYSAQLQDLYSQKSALEAQRTQLEEAKAQLEAAQIAIDQGFQELSSNQLQMENQFAAAEAQIEAGQLQLESGRQELESREDEIADGKVALETAKADLEQGWQDYYSGKEEAEREFADAEAELQDAKAKLDDVKAAILDMTGTDVYVLDRTSNVGYNSLDSSSSIVQGVSRVFPAFFLLIAALVCITTMTRMIDEERTQIGTLKALGYSNGAIISKYLIYAGSGAIVGCGLGVIAGSVVFPMILWEAYKIMLYITPGITLRFNVWLCIGVVVVYTAAMLLVSWYCCRRCLREEPAELIRPKAPEAGKKVLFEKLPIWKRISFLNKVTIRNIFRYHQRLAMMLVGIGGCTALLVTGFGLRDSIVNIVDYQFEEVTVYDLQVYFTGHQTQENQAAFAKKVGDHASNLLFYHQESVDLEYDGQMRQLYLMAADERITEFVDFHSGGSPLDMPGANEALLSVGAAEAMGIHVGDRITARNSEMQQLELTVAGIYDNNVYNYLIVRSQTLENQWGTAPELQMALIQVPEDQDPHEASTRISRMSNVMNVSISEDLAGMVGSMMDALDMVVWVVVFCAGLLAVIVLYNLTNININERIREIATIKVLGFNAGETAAYVFKENLALSVMGTILGMPLGWLLLKFVMSQIKIDFCWFQARVTPLSFFLAVVLTMLSAVIVDVIFHFKLERVNMAEALKSVE